MDIIGIAKFVDGTIAERARLIDSQTLEFTADTIPDGSGNYSFTGLTIGPYFIVITASGQVPLAHGPTSAV